MWLLLIKRVLKKYIQIYSQNIFILTRQIEQFVFPFPLLLITPELKLLNTYFTIKCP